MTRFIRTRRARPILVAGLLAPAAFLSLPLRAADDRVAETDLVSDTGAAPVDSDPKLINAWGVAFVPGGPAYVAQNGSGTVQAYDGTGVAQGAAITVPGPASGGPSAPTGVVANTTPDFTETGGLLPQTLPATLIFATEDGAIAAWNPTLDGTTARRVVDNAPSRSAYKGVAIANNGAANFVYAADFYFGKVAVFDARFNPVVAPGGFTDKSIPANFAPFGIQNVGGALYVTYAKQDLYRHDDSGGKSQGYVDCFDANGYLLRRVAKRGRLNSPWGVAQAPAGFGTFGGDLLVGNFGDGAVDVFDMQSGRALGQLRRADDTVLTVDGLWGLAFGNGANAAQPGDALFFAAGPDGEAHGLYGRLDPTSPTRGK